MDLSALRELNLSKGQVAVYSALLHLGTTSLGALQEKTGYERRNIYDILNKLIERGLVSYTIEKGKRTYQCSHPKKLLEQIKAKKQALNELEHSYSDIRQLYAQSRPHVGAEVFRGNRAILNILSEILEHKKSYWMGGNTFDQFKAPASLQRSFNHWMNKRAEQKHLMYDLVSHGAFLPGLEPKKTAEHKKKYYKYCQLPKGMYIPMVAVVYGNKVAQILWGEQSFAFVMESKKVKDSFMKYFNHFWKEPW